MLILRWMPSCGQRGVRHVDGINTAKDNIGNTITAIHDLKSLNKNITYEACTTHISYKHAQIHIYPESCI